MKINHFLCLYFGSVVILGDLIQGNHIPKIQFYTEMNEFTI